MENPNNLQQGNEALRSWRAVERVNIARDEARRPSEDGVLIDDDCYAVLDGVSSGDSSEKVEGLTPGLFAVHIGIEALKEASHLQDPRTIVPLVSRRLREALDRYTLTTRPSFVFTAFFPKHNMIVRVGDCSYLADGQGSNPGLGFDRLKAKDRARRLRELKEGGASNEEILANDPTRPRMRGLTQAIQPRLANAEHSGKETIFDNYRYGVIRGDEVPEDLVEYISIPAETKSIILATDGYPPQALREDLRETEEVLHRMLKSDPLAIGEMLSTRGIMPETIDDRTYVRLERR